MKKLLSIIMFLYAGVGFSHGMFGLGPHNGIIKMPGAYHTEMVILDTNEVKVYLLDINFKNPTVENSFVKIKDKNKFINCKKNIQDVSFSCKVSKLSKNIELKVLKQKNPEAIVMYP